MVRIAAICLALIIGAWFALGWVQARDEGQAAALLSATSSPSATQAARIRSLLGSAATLNPDRTVDLSRAQLASDLHDHSASIGILERVTRSEPQNALAWTQLGFSAGAAGEVALARQAATQVARLVPPVR